MRENEVIEKKIIHAKEAGEGTHVHPVMTAAEAKEVIAKKEDSARQGAGQLQDLSITDSNGNLIAGSGPYHDGPATQGASSEGDIKAVVNHKDAEESSADDSTRAWGGYIARHIADPFATAGDAGEAIWNHAYDYFTGAGAD